MPGEIHGMKSDQDPTIGILAIHFVTDTSGEGRESSRQHIYKLARWLGWERPITGVTTAEVSRYTEQLSSSTDYVMAVDSIRAFFSYIKKEGYLKTNILVRLQTRKNQLKLSASSGRNPPRAISLTWQGYCDLEEKLNSLKSRRLKVIDEIRKAAADKDFRENAPLQAAREERGHLEGRIVELEETLKLAKIIEDKKDKRYKTGIGDSVILQDLSSGEDVCYTIVSSREVDLSRGKISNVSPLGKAIVGRTEGETIEIETPTGILHYKIKSSRRLQS